MNAGTIPVAALVIILGGLASVRYYARADTPTPATFAATQTNATPTPMLGLRPGTLVRTNNNQFLFLPKPAARTGVVPKPGNMPRPGVYETKPFSCIVVVPGPFPDDSMAKGQLGGEIAPSMPTITPDLKFIPRTPQKWQSPAPPAAGR